MPSQEPNIGLNYGWLQGESGWGAQMDENLRAVGALLHLEVLSRSVTDPTTLTPVDGDRYLIADGAVDVWAGHDGKIARYMAGAWELHTPKAGWRCVIVDENVLVRYDGAAWIGLPTEATIGDGSLGIAKLSDFAQDTSTTSGLTLGYKGGKLRNDNVVHVVAAGTVLLTASATNYVEVGDAGTVSVNQTGFTAGRIPLFEVTTDASAITGVTDLRAWVAVGGGGGGTAASTSYSNVDSDLTAGNVKDAIDESYSITAHKATTHNFATDADYTLTAEQEKYGRIILTDTTPVLTAARSVIVSTDERPYVIQNDTAQTLTVKTSAGTGVDIAAGADIQVQCDGTNVIEVGRDFAAMPLVAGDPIVESGVNADGAWSVTASGLIHMSMKRDFSYSSSSYLSAPKNYPAPYSIGSTNEAWAIGGASGLSSDYSVTADLNYAYNIVNSTSMLLRRNSANRTWASGDFINNVMIVATGYKA